MAESLLIEDGSDLELGLSIFHRNKLHTHYISIIDSFRKFEALNDQRKDSIRRLADIAADNIDKYGHATWYKWAIANWGTKWNAYDTVELNDGVQFDTAWSTPYPIILELSNQYPDATFELTFADEDIGNNCGRYTLKNKEDVEYYFPPSGSDEAYELAIDIKGIELIKDKNGRWVLAEDIEDDENME